MQNELKQELAQNFIEYAAAVNSDRAIPDARCGLKPVARRILYGAYADGYFSNKKHTKCAGIVGEVMKKYHPHGDTSIYGALVRLSQPWVMRYPLIDFHGSNGSQAGDGPAAYRYTEARLSKLSEDGLLYGLKKKNVDFVPTYADDWDEPVTLPSIFPNLLCNPNTGIGVAMASNWLPHNLNEVAQAIYNYMDGKEPMLPGPDFPTGGLIINKDDIPNIMKTGHGSVKIRSKYKIEGNRIVFYEIPFGQTIESLIDEIGEICETEGFENVKDIRDESNKKGLRIVLECTKNANLKSIVDKLFAKTKLQTSISYNQVALVDKTPVELNLKDCIKIYIEHNIDCLKRETKFDLEKAMARFHIVEGLIIALEDIDNVITLIKSSESVAIAKENLMNKYNLSEIQAKAILDMKLSKLAKLEKVELENEKRELVEKISSLDYILQNKEVQIEEIRSRLANIVKKYGDERRTELAQISIKPEEKEIINVTPEKCVVILTEGGTIKRIPSTSFRAQKRNGKGIKTQEDITSMVLRTNTIDSLMIFTNKGKMYRLLVDDIPAGTNASKGTPIRSLISLEPTEEPTVIYSIYRDTDAKYVLFVTKKGKVKKTALDEYIKTKKKSGIGAITITEDDELVTVCLIKDEPLILITNKGYSLTFSSEEIGASSRMTQGVKGINLGKDDFVVTALPIRHKEDSLAIFSKTGLGKKITFEELTVQKRGGKGIICYKPTAESGPVVAACLVSDEDNILVVGNKSSICVSAKEIPALGRTSMGNIIIKGNIIKSVSKV